MTRVSYGDQITVPRPLTVTAAARRLGVSVGSIRRWCDDGVLKCSRTPGGQRRIHQIEIERFLAEMAGDSDPDGGVRIAELADSALSERERDLEQREVELRRRERACMLERRELASVHETPSDPGEMASLLRGIAGRLDLRDPATPHLMKLAQHFESRTAA